MSSIQPDGCERLAQSRERLRQALAQVAPRAPAELHGTPGSPALPWLSHLKTTTETRFLVDLMQAWWQKQPLGPAMTLVVPAVSAMLQPTAQRHPYRLVAGAAAVGAVLVLVRPWRWLSTSTVLTALAAARWVAPPKS